MTPRHPRVRARTFEASSAPRPEDFVQIGESWRVNYFLDNVLINPLWSIRRRNDGSMMDSDWFVLLGVVSGDMFGALGITCIEGLAPF